MKKILKQSLLFDSLTDEQIEKFMPSITETYIKSGGMIFFEKDDADGFYMVKKGKVKIFKMSDEGKEQILHIFGDGDSFGEAAVFSGHKFPANAQAITNAEILFIKKKDLIKIFQKEPSTAMNIISMLAIKLKEFTILVENITLKEIPERLASYIITQEKIQGEKNLIELEFSKGQVAKIIGTTQETFSRVIKKLSTANIIEIDKKKIKISDKKMLEDIAQGIISIKDL
ncbi:MAG: transcriptional regulator [Deltaproteobacteria bacterium]|nr:MAG: transcriptional regulator [Deltaproteobacteria bacterium]